MSRNISCRDWKREYFVTSREGRVSRNRGVGHNLHDRAVTSREGRVSRNPCLEISEKLRLVTSREGRVSRNVVNPKASASPVTSRPARGV